MKWRLAVLIAALTPGAVCAQDTASSWPGLVSSRLSTVYVTDDAGVETSGKLLRLNPDSIVYEARKVSPPAVHLSVRW